MFSELQYKESYAFNFSHFHTLLQVMEASVGLYNTILTKDLIATHTSEEAIYGVKLVTALMQQ